MVNVHSVKCNVYSDERTCKYHLGLIQLFCKFCFITVPYAVNITKRVMLKRSVRTAGICSNCSVAISSLFPEAAFLETLSVVFISSYVSDGNKLENKSPDPS